MAIVDIHCHILPGVDDGSSDMLESVSMAKRAESNGLIAIVATPHSYGFDTPGFFEDPDGYRERIRSALHELRDSLKEEEITVKIAIGMELLIDRDITPFVKEKKFLTLNKSDYLLVEFEFDEKEQFMTESVDTLVRGGYKPIIAHPERYFCLIDNPDLAKNLLNAGGLFQTNAASFTGEFGEKEGETAWTFLNRGYLTALASDAHSFEFRAPEFRDAKKILEQFYNNDTIGLLLYDNPLAIVRNQPVRPVIPEK
ncbi:MAG: hypothetical protein J5850_06575 [Clostridia bacterium]|nr:hypothetical protein [Clostridia bacterium]